MVRLRAARLAVAVAACHFVSTAAQSASEATMASTTVGASSLLSFATSARSMASLASSRTSAAATPSASQAPRSHTIKVGNDGFRFSPQELLGVAAGDTVTFDFYPPDHSVVQAEFGSACVPYSHIDREHHGKGFWTDLQWVNTTQEMTHFTITINDTAPIFFYCAAPGSCIDKHMVGAINPNATHTLRKQIQSAEEADFQLAVGDPVPPEASRSSTPTPAGPSAGGVHLSSGAIAGIVVGAVAFLIICAALFFYVGRSKSLKDMLKRQDGGGGGGSNANPGRASSAAPGPDMGFLPHERYGSPAPPYGVHAQPGEPYWHGSAPNGVQQGHLSMQSQMSGMSQEQFDHYKHAQVQSQPAELHSPEPGQHEFPAELAEHGRKGVV